MRRSNRTAVRSNSEARILTRSPVKKHQSGRRAFTRSARRVASRPGETIVPRWMSESLHDAQPVERRGQRRGAHLRPADAQARTARRDPYHERGEHRNCGGEARAAQSEEVEGVEGQTRQHGRHPDPEEPHRSHDDGRRVVAAEKSHADDRERQRVGRRGPCEREPAKPRTPCAAECSQSAAAAARLSRRINPSNITISFRVRISLRGLGGDFAAKFRRRKETEVFPVQR